MIDQFGIVHCICGSIDVVLEDDIYHCNTCGITWLIDDGIDYCEDDIEDYIDNIDDN